MAKELKKYLEERLSGPKFRLLTSLMTKEKDYKRITAPVIKEYHKGYRLQVKKWKINPVDKIVEFLEKKHKKEIIADIGCGEALIAKKFENVNSFDLFPVCESVVKADSEKLPVKDKTHDVAVFSLSLMKKNIFPTLKEANRVLKTGGTMIIAETQSRIESLEELVRQINRMGFQIETKENIEGFFYFLVFKKAFDTEKEEGFIKMKEFVHKKR